MSIPEPDASTFFDNSGTENYMDVALVSAASNMRFGTNPPYAESDFFAIYPQFQDNVPDPVVTVFLNLAGSCIQQARWGDSWTMGMAWFIAHYCQLYPQSLASTSDPVGKIVAAGAAKSILVSKSVGPVSGSYQAVTQGWEDWGQFNLTVFGQQLIGMAALVGMGPMWIYG